MKKSRNLHINNGFLVVKTENDWRYFGLVVTRNKIIKLLHESTKKGDPAGISLNLCTFSLNLCTFYIMCLSYCIYPTVLNTKRKSFPQLIVLFGINAWLFYA